MADLSPPSSTLVAGKYRLIRGDRARRHGHGVGKGSTRAWARAWPSSSSTPATPRAWRRGNASTTRRAPPPPCAASTPSRSTTTAPPRTFRPYIVMELLEGEPLDKRLERLGRLSLVDTARILLQVCRGLGKAHDLGITHRDLKPENVFLVRTEDDDDEIAKVLDFGIAKMRTAEGMTGLTSGTKTGAVLGTPYFMSPEQARGLKEIDHRTDLWSIGIIAYKCVIGVLPFEGQAIGDLLVKICTSPPPVPSRINPDLPPAFDAWFARGARARAGATLPDGGRAGRWARLRGRLDRAWSPVLRRRRRARGQLGRIARLRTSARVAGRDGADRLERPWRARVRHPAARVPTEHARSRPGAGRDLRALHHVDVPFGGPASPSRSRLGHRCVSPPQRRRRGRLHRVSPARRAGAGSRRARLAPHERERHHEPHRRSRQRPASERRGPRPSTPARSRCPRRPMRVASSSWRRPGAPRATELQPVDTRRARTRARDRPRGERSLSSRSRPRHRSGSPCPSRCPSPRARLRFRLQVHSRLLRRINVPSPIRAGSESPTERVR